MVNDLFRFSGQVKIADVQAALDYVVNSVNTSIDTYNTEVGNLNIDATKTNNILSGTSKVLSLAGLERMIDSYGDKLVNSIVIHDSETNNLCIIAGSYFRKKNDGNYERIDYPNGELENILYNGYLTFNTESQEFSYYDEKSGIPKNDEVVTLAYCTVKQSDILANRKDYTVQDIEDLRMYAGINSGLISTGSLIAENHSQIFYSPNCQPSSSSSTYTYLASDETELSRTYGGNTNGLMSQVTFLHQILLPRGIDPPIMSSTGNYTQMEAYSGLRDNIFS